MEAKALPTLFVFHARTASASLRTAPNLPELAADSMMLLGPIGKF